MKKKIKYALSAIVLFCVAHFSVLAAQRDGRVVERTYLSTDKACYVAGDNIWISAFCLDAGNGGIPSDFSSLSYVELCSANGVEATCKIALDKGRGSGYLAIPRALPTGNYKLIAYTAQNRNEQGYDFFANAKTVSVFNTFTSERAEGAVRVVTDEEYAHHAAKSRQEDADKDGVELSLESRQGRVARLKLTSTLAQASSLCISVYHDDAVAAPANEGVAEFLERTAATPHVDFSPVVVPDFEGEVIRGHCIGDNAAKLAESLALIALPGDLCGVYYSDISKDGEVAFFTNNYYGDNVLVCEIDGDDDEVTAFFELESPFIDNRAPSIATLDICPSLSESLSARSIGMQIERLFDADTLYDKLPSRPNLLFGASAPVSYKLEDYTRFPVMNEVLVEFVKGLRFKHQGKKPFVNATLTDAAKPGMMANQKCLALIDGVPVLDHQQIYDYDPRLVERIDIYPSTYYIGPRSCAGIVDFVTYKRNMPTVTFPESVRIVDFQGACFPLAYTCRNVSENSNYPDYRNTLYWHPHVDLAAGEDFEFDCQLPAYSGTFRVVVEGISAEGRPVSASMTF